MALEPELTELLERCRGDHQAWINGDGSPYELPESGTILGAVGGYSRGGRDTAARQQAVAAQWRRGTGDVEFVNGAIEGDLAWLAFIERSTVEVVTDPPDVKHRWDLRVTEVFQRVEGEWCRVHRHADPLVDRRSLADAFSLLA